MSGLWMSEPRDLMTRLLSMGATGVRESLAHASRGAIFSENRYGIRHFGSILYDPMSLEEEAKQRKRSDDMIKLLQEGTKFTPQSVIGSVTGFINYGITGLVTNAWNNFHRQRDYELFKRNIYPGNGLGIAQYLGGDFGDGGLGNGFIPTGLDADGQFVDPTTGEKVPINNLDPRSILQAAAGTIEIPHTTGSSIDPGNIFNNVVDTAATVTNPIGTLTEAPSRFWSATSPFLQAMGITRMGGVEDDALGFDEVSFRAQTYMKSVWDLFQVCAALLPNYIVAVRPFEDRSTVFYGKPHWMYTSGVIPISTGIDGTHPPTLTPPDDELTSWLLTVEKKFRQTETPSQFYERLLGSSNASGSNDPFATAVGVNWQGGNVDSLPLKHPTSEIVIPQRHANGVRGLHLPTSETIDIDIAQHKQLTGLLPPQWEHPYYMDRNTGNDDDKDFADVLGLRAQGLDQRTIEQTKPDDGLPDWLNLEKIQGNNLVTILGENPDKGGRLPDSGKPVTPSLEEYYVAMGWNYSKGGKQKYYDDTARVLVYNTRTKKGVVCSIQDKTSPAIGDSAIVVSPDTWVLLEAVDGDTFKTGFVDDTYTCGPITSDNTGQFNVGAALGKKAGEEANANNAANLPSWMLAEPGRLNNADTGTDPLKYSLKFGSTDDRVPVDYTDPESGLVDPVGQSAAEVYSKGGQYGEGRIGWDGRTVDDAEDIWDEFREHYAKKNDKYFVQIFNDIFPQFNIEATIPRDPFNSLLSDLPLNPEKFEAVYKAFMDFMWQNPYHRGWLVKTADRKVADGLALVTEDARLFEDVPLLGEIGSGVADFGKSVDNTLSSVTGTLTGGLIGGGDNYDWDFDRAHGLFKVYLSQGVQAAISWMLSHDSPGKDQAGLIGRSTEEFVKKVWDPMYDFLSGVVGGVTSVLSGVVSLIRVGILTLTQGLGMTGYMSKAANYLNRTYNDSIYFDPKLVAGSLMYLADNPFTREYGEPVVEIRQPFQRVHQINSFQHILNNGVQQNSDGVATVVTATTRGKDPVTVWFDKGAPPERQMEKKVETGLWFDKPKGLLGNLFHPVAATRNMFNVLNAQPDELLANRVARTFLKQSLQDIYKGEIVVLGDPSIRPFDLVYIGDAYEQIYGLCEVEQVVHHFTPETGFITSITPNALVTVNDPMRWSATAMFKGLMTQQLVRHKLRSVLGVRSNKALYGLPPETDGNTIADTLKSEIVGSVDYTGGASALIGDFAKTAGAGVLIGGTAGAAAGAPFGLGAPGALVGGLLGGGLAWGAAKWVTENLLDQHACYIQFLNKNGVPMDAGLSYNNGVAVGRQHVATLFANSLRIPISINRDGNPRITTNQLLDKLGYKEYEIEDFITDVDLWNNEINKEILKLSNRSPDGVPFQQIDAKIVTVTAAIDGASFEVAEKDIAANGVRLAGITTMVPLLASPLGEEDPGTASKNYLKKRLITDPTEAGFSPTVALRIDPNTPLDPFGRVLAWVFHNVPTTVTDGDTAARNKALEEQAERWPQIEWDSFLASGEPYTYNWESVLAGFANIDKSLFNVSIPNQGVEGAD